jgi:4-hydroxy-3-polyprenylbenzoate decarboxylase
VRQKDYEIAKKLNTDPLYKELNGKTINLHTNLKGKLKKVGKGENAYLTFVESEKEISDEEGYLDALGKKMPAAVCIGQLPVLFFLSSVGIPWGISEYDAAGGIRKEPVDVIKSDLTGLLIPATAEYVLEGEIDPDPSTYKPEGPFGEYTGYYSAGAGEAYPKPNFHVKRISHRNHPIFWTQSVGSIGAGKNTIPSIQISATIWAALENLRIPGIEAVYCPPEAGGRFMTVVAIWGT